jgi:hypothetical protein
MLASRASSQVRHFAAFHAESATPTVGSLDPRLLRGMKTSSSETSRALGVVSATALIPMSGVSPGQSRLLRNLHRFGEMSELPSPKEGVRGSSPLSSTAPTHSSPARWSVPKVSGTAALPAMARFRRTLTPHRSDG